VGKIDPRLEFKKGLPDITADVPAEFCHKGEGAAQRGAGDGYAAGSLLRVVEAECHPAGLGREERMVEIGTIPLNQEYVHPDLLKRWR
jgi:hypothetical protein